VILELYIVSNSNSKLNFNIIQINKNQYWSNNYLNNKTILFIEIIHLNYKSQI